jgi:two-component system LytT family response regulator
MIKAIIIDDEPLARSVVIEYLAKYPEIEVLQECNDGFEGVKAIMQHQPELVFLDIQMPKITGFEMLELIEQPISVIFTTAFDEYAIKAFDTHAIDYLLKPFSEERFDKAMQKWLQQRGSLHSQGSIKPEISETIIASQTDNQRLVVKKGTNIRIIPIQDIVYLEACDDYVKIYTADDCFLKKKTMTYFEQWLDNKQFIRVHRSFILPLSQITRLQPMEKDAYIALLKSGTKIPLSKTGYAKLREVLGM